MLLLNVYRRLNEITSLVNGHINFYISIYILYFQSTHFACRLRGHSYALHCYLIIYNQLINIHWLRGPNGSDWREKQFKPTRINTYVRGSTDTKKKSNTNINSYNLIIYLYYTWTYTIFNLIVSRLVPFPRFIRPVCFENRRIFCRIVSICYPLLWIPILVQIPRKTHDENTKYYVI